MSAETRETRLKRLKIRSWRRGIREMDLVLGGWADARLSEIGAAELDQFEHLLEENDHDIHAWITGRVAAPERFHSLLDDIAKQAISKLSP